MILEAMKVCHDLHTSSLTGHPIRLAVIMSVTTFIASSITGRPIRLAVIMSITTFIASSITGHPIGLAVIMSIRHDLIGRPSSF